MIDIIQKCIEPLKILSDNVAEEAIVNMLNAKLANMVALAGIRFKQFEVGVDRVVSYYGVCFILYVTGVFKPSLIGIALMFGIGNALIV